MRRVLKAKFRFLIEPTRRPGLPWLVIFTNGRRTTSYCTAGNLHHVEERARKVLKRLNKAVVVADLSKL